MGSLEMGSLSRREFLWVFSGVQTLMLSDGKQGLPQPEIREARHMGEYTGVPSILADLTCPPLVPPTIVACAILLVVVFCPSC